MLSQLLVKGATFFLAPLYTRMMPQADYGMVSVFIGTISIFAIFVGLQTYGSLNNAKTDFSPQEQDKYRSSVLSISVLSFGAVFLLCILLQDILSQLLHIPAAMLFAAVLASFGSTCLSFQNAQSTADGRPKAFLAFSVSNVLLDTVLSVCLIHSMAQKYWGRILAITLSYCIMSAIILAKIFFKGRTFYHPKFWRYCLPLVLPLIFQAASNQILGQCDLLMLNSMKGEAVAGLYSFCHTMGLPLSAIWAAYNAAWVPLFYRKIKENQLSDIQRMAKNYSRIYTLLTCGFILASKEIFYLLADPQYWAGAHLIPLFALYSYLSFLDSLPINYEFYYKKTVLLSLSTALAAVMNIILNYFLIPIWGIYGAIIATLCSYIVMFLAHEVGAYKLGKFPIPVVMQRKNILLIIIVQGLFFLLYEYVLLRWALAFGVGAILLRRLWREKTFF